MMGKKNENTFKKEEVTHAHNSVQDGIYALGKSHVRSTPSLRCFPNVCL